MGDLTYESIGKHELQSHHDRVSDYDRNSQTRGCQTTDQGGSSQREVGTRTTVDSTGNRVGSPESGGVPRRGGCDPWMRPEGGALCVISSRALRMVCPRQTRAVGDLGRLRRRPDRQTNTRTSLP